MHTPARVMSLIDWDAAKADAVAYIKDSTLTEVICAPR